MKISVAVMTHPDRAEALAGLLARLDPLGIHGVGVARDLEGPPSGNADRVWRTARQAWHQADPAADWHVVIQDDALPAADLIEGLHIALGHVPTGRAAVSLYLGQGAYVPARWSRVTAMAAARGASWIRSDKIHWGVGLALPVWAIDHMVSFADRMAMVPDDMRVAGWVRRNQIDVWYPYPSLVDHRNLPSLTKHRAADRRAVRFLGEDVSATVVDWAGPVVTDPMLVRNRGPRSGPSSRRRAS